MATVLQTIQYKISRSRGETSVFRREGEKRWKRFRLDRSCKSLDVFMTRLMVGDDVAARQLGFKTKWDRPYDGFRKSTIIRELRIYSSADLV